MVQDNTAQLLATGRGNRYKRATISLFTTLALVSCWDHNLSNGRIFISSVHDSGLQYYGHHFNKG